MSAVTCGTHQSHEEGGVQVGRSIDDGWCGGDGPIQHRVGVRPSPRSLDICVLLMINRMTAAVTPIVEPLSTLLASPAGHGLVGWWWAGHGGMVGG